VESETNEKIEELIPQGLIDTMTTLVLTNAIYFKADWLIQFDPADTVDGVFTKTEGTDVPVRMMTLTDNFKYAAMHDCQVIEMPYAGESLSMVILLPRRAGFFSFESNLNRMIYDDIIDNLIEREVQVTIPKFDMETWVSLKRTLSLMGMASAFTSGADFSGMDGTQELWLQDVIHQAAVSVNEQGTEAAAGSAALMTRGGGGPISFTADRPFIFIIRDIETGAILFIGRVMEPQLRESGN